MGADQSALVALYAVFRNPFGEINGNAALLVLGSTCRHISGGIKGGNRQAVSLLSQNGMHHGVKILGSGNMEFVRALFSIRPAFGIINLLNAAYSVINSGIVHINYSVALLAVGFLNGLLHIFFRFVIGYNLGELEERGHHDHIDSSAQTDIRSNLNSVNIIEAKLLAGYGVLHISRQHLIHLFLGPRRIEEEHAAFFNSLKDIVTGYIAGIMAGYELSRIDKVRGLNGGLAKTQMGNGKAARFLGIVFKISLSIHIGMVADNFYGVLISANSAVRAQAIEFAAHNSFGSGIYKSRYLKGIARNVVINAHSEMILGLRSRGVVIYSLNHAGRELLRAKTVAAAQNGYIIPSGILKSGTDIGIKRLAY